MNLRDDPALELQTECPCPPSSGSVEPAIYGGCYVWHCIECGRDSPLRRRRDDDYNEDRD